MLSHSLTQLFLNLHSHDEWSVGHCVLMKDDKALLSASCLTSMFAEPRVTRTGGCFCWHCYLFIFSHLFCHCHSCTYIVQSGNNVGFTVSSLHSWPNPWTENYTWLSHSGRTNLWTQIKCRFWHDFKATKNETLKFYNLPITENLEAFV